MKVKICDDLWSKLIKKRAGNQCEKCGKTKYVQAHHIIPRTCYSLRHDKENGVALCRKCHLYWAHKDAIGFYQWIKDIRNLDYLEARRHSQTKNDYKLIEMYLMQKLDEQATRTDVYS